MFNVIIPLLVVEMEISTGGPFHVRLKVLSHLGRYDVKGLLYLTVTLGYTFIIWTSSNWI